jgi:hypothetical protein
VAKAGAIRQNHAHVIIGVVGPIKNTLQHFFDKWLLQLNLAQ